MDRVVLAFSKDETANKIKMMLDGSGYDVYTVCHSKAELLRTVADMDEVLIIMGYKLPDGTVDDVYGRSETYEHSQSRKAEQYI